MEKVEQSLSEKDRGLSEKDIKTFEEEVESKATDRVGIVGGNLTVRGGYGVSTKGGYRPNAGRPRGSKNKLTKDAKVKEKSIKERILKNVDDLVNSQLALAKGLHFLYEIKMRNVAGRRKPEHIRITDPKKIKAFLDGELEGQYHYITAQAPDNKAIDSLLDRAMGKATTESNVDHNVLIEVVDYAKLQNGNKIIEAESPDSTPIYPEAVSIGTDSSTTEV
jgi:hypothetical protein